MTTPKIVEPVQEASTSTRYASSTPSGLSGDPPQELITVVVGSCGRWRIIVTFIFCISMVAYGLHSFSMTLLHPKNIKFYCIQNESEHNKINPCYTSDGKVCTNFSFSSNQGYTITEKYALVCDNGLRIAIIKFGFRFSLISGYILFGIIADKYGRKNLFIISLFSQLACGVLISAHTNYWFYTAFNCFHGMFLAGMTLISTILTCEISANNYRTFNMGLLCISTSIGCILLPYIWMQIFSDARSLSILYCLHFFILFFVYFVRESPSWLLSKNCTSEAENVVTLVSRFNGFKISNFRIRPVQITAVNKSNPGLCDMLKTSTRKMVLALLSIWFFMFLMHAVNRNSNAIKIRDPIFLTKILGSVSLCAASLSILMCYCFKHKITIALASILTFSISIASYVISGENIMDNSILTLQLGTYGASKLLSFTVFNMTPCVFPTELRCRGTAVAFAIGEFSYTITNLIFMYCVDMSLGIMLVLVSISTIFILLAVSFLYSTHNRELPDLLEDSLNFNHRYKPVRWTTLRPISATIDEVAIKVIDFERGTSISVPYKKGNSSKKKTQDKSTQD